MRTTTFLSAALSFALVIASLKQGYGVQTAVLQNSNGMEVHVLDIGGVIQRLLVPDFEGVLGDVVLGFDDPDAYDTNVIDPYFGAIIGRVCNRIANASFELDGKHYDLVANENGNQLHGGKTGWSARVWNLTTIDSPRGEAVKLTYTSPDGEEGYPGTVEAAVTYTLTPSNEVIITYEATTDAPTPIGMTQHSYFNLDGPGTNKTVLDHEIFINGSYVTPTNALLIPTGEFEPVNGTAYAFETPYTVGSRTMETNTDPEGYDINYVLWGLTGSETLDKTHDCVTFDSPQLAATAYSPITGRAFDVFTQTPGLQFYTGIHLNGSECPWEAYLECRAGCKNGTSVIGKDGASYAQYGGLAMETQDFPNFINEPAFPQCVLRPGQTYRYETIWRFYIKEGTSAVAAATSASN